MYARPPRRSSSLAQQPIDDYVGSLQGSGFCLRGLMGMKQGFTFPSAEDLLDWSRSARVSEPSNDLAALLAKEIRQRSWWFTVSAAIPSIIGVALAFALKSFLAGQAALRYWSQYAVLATIVLTVTAKRRAIFVHLSPTTAVTYYTSACIDRLRRYRPAGPADKHYLCIMLPTLEQVLAGEQLNRRVAGTSHAREAVRRVQLHLASRIGHAEARWSATGDNASSDDLARALGETLVIVQLDEWQQVTASKGDRPTTESTGHRPSIRTIIREKLVEKGIDHLVTTGIGFLSVMAAAYRGRLS
jgi:hypothetical protein